MATLTKSEIVKAFERIGALAAERGRSIRLILMGGALMCLAHGARDATKDVDAVAVNPGDAALVRDLAAQVAEELGWPPDWLNDGAKGYLVSISDGGAVFTAPGIEVRCPRTEQLLAMKLAAWRDDVDICDARVLLDVLRASGERDAVCAHSCQGAPS